MLATWGGLLFSTQYLPRLACLAMPALFCKNSFGGTLKFPKLCQDTKSVKVYIVSLDYLS